MVVAGHANVKFSYTIALSIVNNVSLIGVMRWRYVVAANASAPFIIYQCAGYIAQC